jgi:hypothetical protein
MQTSDIKVTVIEHQGKLGDMKARALCAFLLRFYEENKEDVDRRAEEIRQSREKEESHNDAQ